MSVEELGCCGAYCKTCPVYKEQLCRGCKLGYANGERDLAKAKCQIKICCIGKNHNSCADCGMFNNCSLLQKFYNKNGYKYNKYRQALEYIRTNGYAKFISLAEQWTRQYGKYE
jgi:hypothetical protein